MCEYWQNVAVINSLNKEESLADGVIRIKKDFPSSQWNNEIDKLRNNFRVKRTKATGLEYLKGMDADAYLEDMYVAQNYAKWNRREIGSMICMILGNPQIKEVIETIHNFIDPNDKIIRKGSVQSYVGKKFILPFNMRDGILICEGKSNPDWNFSAPHGAGRVYSRARAKAELNLSKFKDDMSGIFSKSVCINTIDESPDAYKDSKIIEACIEPTATILDRIIPIHNLKDNSDSKPWKK